MPVLLKFMYAVRPQISMNFLYETIISRITAEEKSNIYKTILKASRRLRFWDKKTVKYWPD